MKEIKTKIFLGDCKDILKDFDNDCVDLIFAHKLINIFRNSKKQAKKSEFYK